MKHKKFVSVMSLLIILISTVGMLVGCSEEKKQSSTSSVKQEASSTSAPAVITNTAEKDEENSEDKSSTKWDEILDNYEAVINEYAKIMKKVKSGDSMAALNSVTVLEKVEKLSQQFESTTDELTTEQISRLTELQTKISKLALE